MELNHTEDLSNSCKTGDVERVRHWIDQGVNINKADKNGDFPLHISAEKGHLDIVKVLLECGVDTNVVDSRGQSPQLIAAKEGRAKVWELIMGSRDYIVPPFVIGKEMKSSHYRNIDKTSSEPKTTKDEKIQKVLKENEITETALLGSGQFGQVWKGLFDKKMVAVKILKDFSSEAEGAVIEELTMLGALEHESIIKQLCFVADIPAIVMEFAEMGNLHDLLKWQQKPVGWITRMKWSMQLINGLEYLHKKELIHRDLRCVNILVTKDFDLKISDFGVSIWFNEKGGMRNKPSYQMTDVYTITKDEDSLKFSLDIRMFAVVLAKMLLFGEEVDADIYDWKQGSIISELPCDLPSYMNLIQICYCGDISARLCCDLVRSICIRNFINPRSTSEEYSWIRSDVQKDFSSLVPFEGWKICAVKEFLSWLQDRCLFVRCTVIRILGKLDVQDPAVISILVSMLQHENELVRQSTVKTLGELKVQDSTLKAALLSMLGDRNSEMRLTAVETLGELNMQDPALISALVSTLRSDNKQLRKSAVRAFGKLQVQDPTVVSTLVSIFKDKDEHWYARESALETLGEFKICDPTVVSALVSMLDDDLWKLRKSAIETLRKLKVQDPMVISALVPLLKNDTVDVRIQIFNTFGELKVRDPIVVSTLVSLLKDSNEWIRGLAVRTLGELEIEDPTVMSAVVLMLKDSDSLVREVTAETLQNIKIQDPAVMSIFISMLGEENVWVRQSVARAIGKLGVQDPTIIPTLVSMLGHKDKWVRQSTIKILGELKIQDPEMLKIALEDTDEEVRTAAARILSSLVE